MHYVCSYRNSTVITIKTKRQYVPTSSFHQNLMIDRRCPSLFYDVFDEETLPRIVLKMHSFYYQLLTLNDTHIYLRSDTKLKSIN